MKIRTGVFTLTLVITLLAGCMTAPDRDGESIIGELPVRWTADSATAAHQIAEHWVDTFQLPKLKTLVQEALTTNHDLKAAAARVEIAQAAVRIAGAPRLPHINALTDVQRGRQGTFVVDEDRKERSLLGALFSLSWELDIWGRIRAARDAASFEAQAVSTDLNGAALSLAARTAQSWFALLEAGQQEAVARQSVSDRRMLVELVRGRFTRGLAQGLDLSLALTDLANAEAQLAETKNLVQVTSRHLEVLLGRYPAGELSPGEPLPPLPPTLPAGVPAELLERRPDIIAAMRRLQAQDQRLLNANLALLPNITLTAWGGVRSTSLKDVIRPEALVWNVGAGLLQPIFAGDRLEGNIARQEAAVTEALEDFHQTALEAFQEVEQSLATEERLSARERALAEAVRHAEANQRLSVYAYRHGFTTILTLLDSFRGTLEAQSAHLTVKRRLLNNRIDLHLALGGAV
ncbi:MAG: TolC family protein [Nitrospirales bacterium]|nr:TolC family protein [Nitrospirales bacterium]